MLAKWMTLRADEDRLLSYANVGGAGCQVPLAASSATWSAWSAGARRRGEAQNGGVGLRRRRRRAPGGSSSAVSSSIRF